MLHHSWRKCIKRRSRIEIAFEQQPLLWFQNSINYWNFISMEFNATAAGCDLHFLNGSIWMKKRQRHWHTDRRDEPNLKDQRLSCRFSEVFGSHNYKSFQWTAAADRRRIISLLEVSFFASMKCEKFITVQTAVFKAFPVISIVARQENIKTNIAHLFVSACRVYIVPTIRTDF